MTKYMLKQVSIVPLLETPRGRRPYLSTLLHRQTQTCTYNWYKYMCVFVCTHPDTQIYMCTFIYVHRGVHMYVHIRTHTDIHISRLSAIRDTRLAKHVSFDSWLISRIYSAVFFCRKRVANQGYRIPSELLRDEPIPCLWVLARKWI